MVAAAPRRMARWLRWLIRVFVILLIAVVLLGGLGVWWVSSRMEQLAGHVVGRVLPGLRASIEKIEWRNLPSLEVNGVVLAENESGEEVVGVVSVAVDAGWRDLFARKVRRIELESLRLRLTPQFFKAFQRKDGHAGPASGTPFAISEIVCRYGEFSLSGVGPRGLVVDGKFAFEFRDLLEGGEQTLTLWDVRAADSTGRDFLVLHLLEADFEWKALVSQKRVKAIRLRGGELALGDRLLALFEPSGASEPAAEGLTIGVLEISGIAVDLEDARQLAADVGFTLNTTLANIPLGKAASVLGEEIQFVELEDITILSPYNPLAKVLTVRALGVEFSLAGLLKKEIASISTTSPSIYVSEDLFWYMDEAAKRFSSADAEEPGDEDTDWNVMRFALADGHLILGSGGSSSYGLPLTFRTTAEDVSLANLAGLRARFAMEIPARNYEFADYQLAFETQAGTLRFAYPPEKEENNLVGTVNVSTLRWRQYKAEEAWTSVTFDRSGINGLFGGRAYRGYVSGGFSFFFTPEAPWIGWISGEGIDTDAVTEIAAPQNFRMSGPLDFRTQVDARRKEILRLKGDLHVRGPGQMTITKLDDLLARIPDGWPSLKQDSTRIALEALRDFPYDEGRGDFWFVDGQGIFDLGLHGPSGSRTFKVVLHRDTSPAGRWKQSHENDE